ncbi:family 78 glycoside hydrolase catalytic domain [bacterium]|nr:family 78 glycoside hydrolase catalytic domain [bacterium]
MNQITTIPLILSQWYSSQVENTLAPLELKCEYAVNPLGVDVAQPRFSWEVSSSQRGQIQSAYQILVASSEEQLNANIGDKWDSGKVTSDKSVNIAYEGSALASAEKCCWKVRCWDEDDKASAYSKPATFEMGLLNQSDWEGKWIGSDVSISAPLLRQEFEITKKIKCARTYISGVGWYELYINGEKVGDHVLDPATTDYAKRILYAPYDVTALLREGANAVGVMLGNGWYSEPGFQRQYGDSPRLLLQMNIEFTDGSTTRIQTDETWKSSNGPITHNDLYGGETYDARLEKPGWTSTGYDDSGWDDVVIKESPGGKMVSQLMPAIKVNQKIEPINLTNPKPGVYVYDMGQLFGGWTKIHLKGPRDTKVTIKYADRISSESGLVDQERWLGGHSSPETDFYILKGDPEGEIYEPRFTYHPVRYVQIEGYPGELTLEDIEGRVVYSAVDMSGDFHCSNPIINQIHQNVVWTLANGLFGIPLDCLHREHWAWTDPATIAGSIYPRKYMPLFWTKWLNDIKDAQRDDGAVPDIAPSYPTDRSDPAWGSNYPILVWYLHQYYGDVRILQEHYDGMKRWLDYLASIADNHIVTEGHYGDHLLPGNAPGEEEFISSETPPLLVWTGYYYRSASIVSQIADILGKPDDAEHYSELAEKIKDAFNDKWLDKNTDQYATGSETANLFPLVLDIIPKANENGVLKNIIEDIMVKHDGHLHTGNTGTTCMIDTLTERGFGDVMYQVATTTTYPSWGYMVKEGATTIWEAWGKSNAADSMIMWATIDEFFYNDLAGIKGPDYHGPGYMTPGFREIEIKPHVLGDLTFARASIRTVRGIVSSSWQKMDSSLTLEVSIPVNSRAKVSVPKIGLENVIVEEGGKTIWKDGSYVSGVAGIADGSDSPGYVTFDVGSGSYLFRLSGTPKLL